MHLEGWGRYPRFECELVEIASPEAAPALVAGRHGLIARGNGRAYGDAAIGERVTLRARRLDRVRAFDPDTGRLTVEAGALLGDLIATFLPRGFFPPVVPGTQLVTVGGMIASDVHGKNHHRDGGFGDHLESLRLALPGGEVVTCSPTEHPELLWATVGGMGLTGVILEATFRLLRVESGWIRQRTVVAPDLAGALAALDEADAATYSVAWIDGLARGAALGRSLIYVGEHATRAEVEADRPGAPLFPAAPNRRIAVPFDLPGATLNRLTVGAFNERYYRQGASRADAPFLTHWDSYFFPLDGIAGWNRIYGRRGFLQHQCVLPTDTAPAALAAILDLVSHSGRASFLAVLKKMRPGRGLLSFPIEGYTLALDMQVGEESFRLLDAVDRLVVEAGGRLYLAKDARQSRATFEAGYSAASAFRALRRAHRAEGHIASRLSCRLGI